jgi:hypothetical protein
MVGSKCVRIPPKRGKNNKGTYRLMKIKQPLHLKAEETMNLNPQKY